MKYFTGALFSTILIVSCAPQKNNPQAGFMQNLSALCGKSFAGKLVSTDDSDKDLAAKPMVMQVSECSEDAIHIPFHIADNHSRTWIISKTPNGLRLKHRHNHEDGHADSVSMYGGDTDNMGTATRQTFPVDQFSKDMFMREGLDVSITNIWAIDITDKVYAYELRRKNRHFRVEFDLSAEIAAPPNPW